MKPYEIAERDKLLIVREADRAAAQIPVCRACSKPSPHGDPCEACSGKSSEIAEIAARAGICPAKRKTYGERIIANTERDLRRLWRIHDDCAWLMERNTEASTGSCLLDGITVLLEAAIGHYESYARDIREREATEESSGL